MIRMFEAVAARLAVLALLLGWVPAGANEVPYQVKASYIYNILQFVDFPSQASSDSHLHVCILGENRFGSAIREIDGASAPSGRIHVHKLGRFTEQTSLARCQVLYIVETEKHALERIMARVDRHEVLTISEFGPFLGVGGLIELYQQDDMIRFRINENLVGKTAFRLDAQLVQLGISVPDPEALRLGRPQGPRLIASWLRKGRGRV